MTCTKCKKEIAAESIFCMFCGKKQAVTQRPKDKKRANGMGSIRLLPGTRKKPYQARVTIRMADGTKKRISYGTFPTSTLARKAVESYAINGVSEHYDITVEAAYEKWNEVHYKNLSNSGKRTYETAWKHFDKMRNVKLSAVKTHLIQDIINAAVENSLSTSSCNKIKLLASQICKWGMQNDILSKNYAEFVVVPSKSAAKRDSFSGEELSKLKSIYEKTNDSDIGSIILLCYTGFRLNEFLSLKKTDYRDGCLYGGNKTEKGKNRAVPVPDAVKRIVDALIEIDGEYLYSNADGGKCEPTNWRKRVYYKALEKAGYTKEEMKNRTPHSCRHTFASLCVKKGVDPKALQDIIGHEDISTTMNIYTHTDTEWLKAAIKGL